jgi:hypothetical protein
MKDIPAKVNGDTLSAAEWNGFYRDIRNFLLSIGIVLTENDLDQMAKAVAAYASVGFVYEDSGAADAYDLSPVNLRQSFEALIDGMVVEFVPDNTNTGPSTVDLIAVKDIRDFSGAALTGGEIVAGVPFRMRFISASDHWRFDLPRSTTALAGILKTASQAIANGGANATDAITSAVLKNLTMTIPGLTAGAASSVSAASIGQGALKTTTEELFISLPGAGGPFSTNVVSVGGSYSLGHEIKTTGLATSVTGEARPGILATSSASYTNNWYFTITTNNSGAMYMRNRYVQASPPYDLGDGDIPLFLFAEIDTQGRVIKMSIAEDPVWANNGPTCCRASKYDANGVGYRARRDMSMIPFTLDEAVASGDVQMLRDYCAAMAEAKTIYEEITQEIKHADMNLIPTPWGSVSSGVPNTTRILVDPVSDILQELKVMRKEHDLFDTPKLFSDGMLIIDSDQLSRNAPHGLPVHKIKWKNTQ